MTYEHAREVLQASDVEIARGLRNRRVLILSGMFPILSFCTIGLK